MSTRSAIGILSDDGRVLAIYCHWDGYLSHNGKMLQHHYNSLSRAKKLLSYGNASFIAPELGRKHNFDKASTHHPDWCCFYARDRNETDQQAKSFDTTKEFEDHYDWSEYYYLFTNGKWVYKRSRDEIYHDLATALNQVEAA
jgi:hypothetical protein